MALTKTERKVYSFSGGLNTDAPLIAFPENQTTDEMNYTLEADGSRRRRKGVLPENFGVNGATNYIALAGYYSDVDDVDCYQLFEWNNAGGNPEEDFLVLRVGKMLFVYRNNTQYISDNFIAQVDLTDYIVDGATGGTAALDTGQMDGTTGRGHLFLVHKYLEPIFLDWDKDNTTVVIERIHLRERDFIGIDDGVGNNDQLTDATIPSTHLYNLQNRGWKYADITSFKTSKSYWPTKAMIPWLGYRRGTTASVAEQDWTKSFSPDKLVGELFQDVSAPQGHFVREVFNPQYTTSQVGNNITAWSFSSTTPGATITVTFTTGTAHGLSISDVVLLEGTRHRYQVDFSSDGYYLSKQLTFDGSQTVTAVPTATTFSISYTLPITYDNTVTSNVYGRMYTELSESDLANALVRPTCVEFFAGRVWWAGVTNSRIATRIYFSQTIESDVQYGKCYQQADPTDERINVLVATDGGFIDIPDADQVVQLMAYSGSLLVFARTGVWQISGPDGYFTANNYVVRKLSDVGCVAKDSAIIAETIPMYWAEDSIYAIVQDENSGYLVAKNISVNRIDNYLKGITISRKERVMATYDPTNKKVYWAFWKAGNSGVAFGAGSFNYVLVYDLRFNAFTIEYYQPSAKAGCMTAIHAIKKAGLSDPIRIVYSQSNAASSISHRAFIGERSDTTFLDFNQNAYLHVGAPTPAYIVTNYDTSGDATRQKYGANITVFSKKTETGYTIVGTDYVPVNESSTKLQARWDWADNSSAGKWGGEQEVYVHPRMYQPVDENDTYADGAPLVIAKRKLRGSGRSLHLKFTAGTKGSSSPYTGYDSHLVGWQLRTNVKTEW